MYNTMFTGIIFCRQFVGGFLLFSLKSEGHCKSRFDMSVFE